jgi:hypothetical protein
MKFIFWIAGKELDAWRSKHVRLGGKMMESYVTNHIIGLWDIEMSCGCEDAMGHLKKRIESNNR